MRIATFNIEHGRGADGGPPDLDELIETCIGFDADVLALQEVDRNAARSSSVDQAKEIAQAMGASYTFGTTQRVSGGEYGNALIVRGGLTDVQVIPLPRRLRDEPRVVITASVRVDGHEIGVAATHLSVDRALAGEQLIEVIDVLALRPPPRLLLGDLNMPIDEVLPITTAERYQLVRTAPTFPNLAPHSQIDHIALCGLVGGDVEVLSTPISDHRAVIVEVEVA